jgi:hypothetical protein
MPAAIPQTPINGAASAWWRPHSPPANTAKPQVRLAVNMRRKRWRYGSDPSEKATLSAPVAPISPLLACPMAAPIASVKATHKALRRAKPGRTTEADVRFAIGIIGYMRLDDVALHA